MTAARSSASVALGLGLAFALALGGCGDSGEDGDGIATADRRGATAVSGSPSPDDAERQRRFVECLRGRGIDVDDPEPGQPLRLEKKTEVATREALEACREFAPAAGGRRVASDLERDRQYAACMRANGVPDFPDPDPDAGLLIPKSIIRSPQFEAADRACGERLKPGPNEK